MSYCMKSLTNHDHDTHKNEFEDMTRRNRGKNMRWQLQKKASNKDGPTEPGGRNCCSIVSSLTANLKHLRILPIAGSTNRQSQQWSLRPLMRALMHIWSDNTYFRHISEQSGAEGGLQRASSDTAVAPLLSVALCCSISNEKPAQRQAFRSATIRSHMLLLCHQWGNRTPRGLRSPILLKESRVDRYNLRPNRMRDRPRRCPIALEENRSNDSNFVKW